MQLENKMGVPKSIRTDGKRESLGGFALTIPSSLPCELPARYLKKVSKCQQKAYLRILVLFYYYYSCNPNSKGPKRMGKKRSTAICTRQKVHFLID